MSRIPELHSSALVELRRHYREGKVERSVLRSELTQAALGLRAIQYAIVDTSICAIHVLHDELVSEFKSGVRMYWNPEDLGSAPNIAFVHGDYEPEETALLCELSRGKSTVLDIGANVGWFSLHIANVLKSDDRQIYAFEPIPRTHKRLAKNIAVNDLDGVIKLSREGFSDAKGETTFYIPVISGPSAASIKNLHPDEQSEAVVCKLNTVDAFLEEQNVKRIDLVKCDVEGAELLVLQGAKRLLEKDRPVLFLELLRKWSKAFGYHPNEVLELLKAHGYSCWGVGKGRIRPVEYVDDDTVETNFLFLTEAHSKERGIISTLTFRQE